MSLPIFFENSRVPAYLSFISPISIGAITLGPFVFSRGEISERTRNHESIHWEQYKETLILGFLLLYAFYWVVGLIKYRGGMTAYFSIPFEQEAYAHDDDMSYISNRRRFSWWNYKT